MDRRDSEFKCPKCGSTLVERWEVRPHAGVAPRLTNQLVGRPSCPQGHRITTWGIAGQPIHAV